MKKYIISIDQGTTSTRAILFDQQQNIVAVSQEEIHNSFPQPGWVEQDANEIWLSTLSCLSSLFLNSGAQPDEVASIGITNQRETTVVWNKKTGMPIHNAIVWQSRQTAAIVERYKKMGVEPLIKEKTGLVLDPYFSATKIRWILEEKNIQNTEDLLFGTIDTWLVWKMTNGKVHVTDVTNASRTLLLNIHTLDWDKELLELFNIPQNMLPQVVDTSGIVGSIDPVHFFNTSCPIGAMVGDQQSALFGQSCFHKGEVKNTYGTGGFLLMNTGDTPIHSQKGLLSTVAWKIQDEVCYALEGSIFVSGSLIQWLRDGLKFFKSAKETEDIATSVDSCNGVMIVPAFTGLGAPYWNDECRGAIFGLTRGTDIRHLVRASLESMAYQSKDLILVMEEDLHQKITHLKVDGGASANCFLNQFQSDILEIPVYKSVMTETTALGAARLAGLACGFYKREDFKDGKLEEFLPQRDHESIEKLYEKWKKAIQATQMY
ncbi:glycerol kinase GlpK [Faecalicoccus pleomorphus]|uniref:glycerol kinase GlpK n=1 Tax=Faecalicoccus pleomorphus TaxID=1323 RepID=UPI0019611551|nr:glycerol kinase GlpK [Faecalicoccus pleomorphus]MBM6808854.1 glycerol kinase GlpK [Faecalicoccus pleomorphus]